MPSPPLLDPSTLDTGRVLLGPEKIRAVNPQRFEMEMLSGILRYSGDDPLCVGFKDLRLDDFWTRGHLPGRPLLPGVLMIEAAAQLAGFLSAMRAPPPAGRFWGFGGLDAVRFRGVVVPPCRLFVAASLSALRSTIAVCDAQAFVGAKMVFEGRVLGALV